MAGNSFGNIFKLTTFGESHGLGIGGVIDGCPSGFKIDLKMIQNDSFDSFVSFVSFDSFDSVWIRFGFDLDLVSQAAPCLQGRAQCRLNRRILESSNPI